MNLEEMEQGQIQTQIHMVMMLITLSPIIFISLISNSQTYFIFLP